MDQMLQDDLTIITDDPAKTYPNINVVWSKFQSIFGILIPLLSYEPVARDYFYQGFKEFKDDQVQYLYKDVLIIIYYLTFVQILFVVFYIWPLLCMYVYEFF